jgi:hypothetical protein
MARLTNAKNLEKRSHGMLEVEVCEISDVNPAYLLLAQKLEGVAA